jgi:carbon monoxide dehydrogenase subunit G
VKTHSVTLQQHIDAPANNVAAFISDFRNARQWMVGVEEIEELGDDTFRLTLESPVGKLEPSARVVEQGNGRIRWVYTSTLDGGGSVEVHPSGSGSMVHYTGEFRLKSGLVDRLARAVGLERFAHRNGERSLQRLKYLLEAHRRG